MKTKLIIGFLLVSLIVLSGCVTMQQEQKVTLGENKTEIQKEQIEQEPKTIVITEKTEQPTYKHLDSRTIQEIKIAMQRGDLVFIPFPRVDIMQGDTHYLGIGIRNKDDDKTFTIKVESSYPEDVKLFDFKKQVFVKSNEYEILEIPLIIPHNIKEQVYIANILVCDTEPCDRTNLYDGTVHKVYLTVIEEVTITVGGQSIT